VPLYQLKSNTQALETFKESKKGHCARRNKKQAKWNPTKDFVWGDLAGLYAGFIFSVHTGSVPKLRTINCTLGVLPNGLLMKCVLES
jgi:hypothetical protein